MIPLSQRRALERINPFDLRDDDEAVEEAPARKATRLEWGFMAAWGALVVLTCAYLLGAHLLALPQPAAADRHLVAAMARVRDEAGVAGAHRWVILHALYADCGCSQRVLHALLQRGAQPGVVETIAMVGTLPDLDVRAAALAHGYRFAQVTAEQLDRDDHIEAVPMLVIADPDGAVRYVGGYTARKQGAVVRDVEMLAQLRAGHTVTPLPIFGCAVSGRLRALTDPFRIR